MTISFPPQEYYPLLAAAFSVGGAVGIAAFNWYLSRRTRKEDLQSQERERLAVYAGKVAAASNTVGTYLIELEGWWLGQGVVATAPAFPGDWVAKASRAMEPLSTLAAEGRVTKHPNWELVMQAANEFHLAITQAKELDGIWREILAHTKSMSGDKMLQDHKAAYAHRWAGAHNKLVADIKRVRETLGRLTTAVAQ